MAPTSAMLQGLNIVHRAPQPSTLTDSQDLLGSPPFSNDLAAQLDLWTNLSFASDEPFVSSDRDALDGAPYGKSTDKLSSSPPSPTTTDSEVAQATAADVDLHHDNAAADVVGSGSDTFGTHNQQGTLPTATTNYDFDHFLANFGVDPFQIPPNFTGLYPGPTPDELAALQLPPLGVNTSFPAPPALSMTNSGDGSGSVRGAAAKRSGPVAVAAAPPAKKARTRKSSTASTPAPDGGSTAGDNYGDDDDDLLPATNANGTPLTPAEDKRRRNTAASARFRLKKKEREQQMDKKSKDLENKVSELERECEGLRRENTWLRGLVVGQTNGVPGMGAMAGLGMTGAGVGTLGVGSAAGAKRAREQEASDNKLVGAL